MAVLCFFLFFGFEPCVEVLNCLWSFCSVSVWLRFYVFCLWVKNLYTQLVGLFKAPRILIKSKYFVRLYPL